ncbi:MAG: cysteine synthase A [Desulfatibacillaceae bacterium]|nr:cysteine synthase A [Desulfatibacillaceae bacterium]
MRIWPQITSTIGKTPLVRIRPKNGDNWAPVAAKLEFFNPLGSVKDRIGLAMMEDAIQRGLVEPDTLVVEATSGNTGIALASICAAYGYRLLLTMPETMSIERRKILKHLGAQIVLTPAAEGMAGALEEAKRICAAEKNSFMPDQFNNPANPQIHRQTTAMEILEDTGGKIGAFVCGVGTGGTITGVGQVLKEHDSGIKIVAVEPAASPVLSGGKKGPHSIQGIGAGFVPSVLDTSVIDEVITVTEKQAFETARMLASTQGIFCGISSGAAAFAAFDMAARKEMAGRLVVTILPSTGERYMSTGLFAD